MKNLILTLIITLPLTLLGQGWEQTYGGIESDEGWSVQQTNDGGYIICGTSGDLFPGSSVFTYLIKTDQYGDEIWSQTYGTFGDSLYHSGKSVKQTSDGGFIIGGEVMSTWNGLGYLRVFKTDGNGNEIWNNTYGNLFSGVFELGSIQNTMDGGYILVGLGPGPIDSGDILLIKIDENGNEIWTNTFGGVDQQFGRSGLQTSDGGYIITGSRWENGNYTSFLLKTDQNGNEIWNQTFGFGSGFSVRQTTDGGYIISGREQVNGLLQNVLTKTDQNGNIQWTQNYEGVFGSSGYSVKQTDDNGFIITGYTSQIDTLTYLSLIKTDENGNEQWSQIFGRTSLLRGGRCVQQTTDGGYVLTGSKFENGNSDVCLIKTDDQGNISSTTEIPLPNPNRKLEKTVNIKGQEIKPQTNQPIIEIFDDGTVEKKIVVE